MAYLFLLKAHAGIINDEVVTILVLLLAHYPLV